MAIFTEAYCKELLAESDRNLKNFNKSSAGTDKQSKELTQKQIQDVKRHNAVDDKFGNDKSKRVEDLKKEYKNERHFARLGKDAREDRSAYKRNQLDDIKNFTGANDAPKYKDNASLTYARDRASKIGKELKNLGVDPKSIEEG